MAGTSGSVALGRVRDLVTQAGDTKLTLVHNDDVEVGGVLAHVGVKGMKWGVRKRVAARSARRAEWKKKLTEPTEVKVKAKAGKKVTAEGGKRQAPSQDAIKAAVARQKAKASTTDSLSNDELRQLVDRMNLEANYARLTSARGKSRKEKGLEFVNEMIADAGQGAVTNYAGTKFGKTGEKAVEMTFEALRNKDNKGGKK